MCYTITVTSQFAKDLKHYEKTKGFRNVRNDIKNILEKIENGNFVGTPIPDLKIKTDNHTYKVRAANSDTKVGTSNGYRLLYYVVKDDKEVFLLTLYYKKDDNDIPTNTEIADLVKKFCLN